MALLDQNSNTTPSYEQIIAQRLKEYPAQQFHQLLSSWESSVRTLWKNGDTQAILNIIGTDAAELFLLSQQTALFLESLKPGCTADTIALVKDHTVNPDGTITITPEIPPPDEEPVDPGA